MVRNSGAGFPSDHSLAIVVLLPAPRISGGDSLTAEIGGTAQVVTSLDHWSKRPSMTAPEIEPVADPVPPALPARPGLLVPRFRPGIAMTTCARDYGKLVRTAGLEPATSRPQTGCSTTELSTAEPNPPPTKPAHAVFALVARYRLSGRF